MKFALTMNVDYSREPYDALNHSYVAFCQRLGILPVPVPNTINDLRFYLDALGIQGVMLTGGNDISPRLYGSQAASSPGRRVSAIRDSVEECLLQMAVEQGLPVLGICRGMQFINVFFGGGLVPDVQSLGGDVEHVGLPHSVKIVHSKIGEFLHAAEITVNSYHNQGVTKELVSESLEVIALCGDGLIEGVMHPLHHIMGIQWHPERPGSSSECDIRLIEGFLQGIFW